MSKTWLYGLTITIFILCQFLIFSKWYEKPSKIECPIKSSLSIPCPLCGSISGAVHIYQGNISAGIQSNPLGIALLVLGCIAFLFLLYDQITGSSILSQQYQEFEKRLSYKWFKVVLITVVTLNWIWVIFQS